jgi:anti-anti-sigma factor
MDHQDAIQHGDLEDATDLRLGDDQLQLTLAGAQALGASEQHAEGHGIDEGRVGQIDEHALRSVVDDVVQQIAEGRSEVKIRLTVHGYEHHAGRKALDLRPRFASGIGHEGALAHWHIRVTQGFPHRNRDREPNILRSVASYELEHMVPDGSGVACVALSGELDLTNAGDLAERLDDLADGAPVVLDLNRLVFIDSAAIHRLFRIAQERGRRSVAFVVEPTAPVATTLEIAELGRAATVAATYDDAKAILTR